MNEKQLEKMVEDFVQIGKAIYPEIGTCGSSDWEDTRAANHITSRIIAAKILKGDYDEQK